MLQQLSVHGGPQLAELQRCHHIPHAQPALGELLISTIQVREVMKKIKAELERSDSFHSTLAMTWHVSQLVLWVSKHIYFHWIYVLIIAFDWLTCTFRLSGTRNNTGFWCLTRVPPTSGRGAQTGEGGELFHIILFQILRNKNDQYFLADIHQ